MLTTALAVYGAALSSFLGSLSWRKERQRIYFAPRFVRAESGGRLELVVVNTGHRPVTLSGACLEYEDGQGGYWPMLDEEAGLPCKLGEGDTLSITIDQADLAPEISSVVMEGYGRDFRHVFDADFRKNWAGRG